MSEQDKAQINPEKNNKPKELHNAANSEKKKGGVVTLAQDEYEVLKVKAEESELNLGRLMRAQAEFENTRKRLEREKQDFIKFANEGIIIELLNILDDLERTIEVAQSKNSDLPVFLKGVEMILAHLYDMLKEHGIKPIEAEGKIFDPHYHEALMQVEDSNFPEHTVIEELQKGYLLYERVIRTAKVKISKHGSKDIIEKK
ncbi:MAG: nucleotide exchange factor GrpE [Candidatus Omnitrophota bacterium]|nr:nucleotide exchange factor GrpE [Candidatus Omnitrophota bacterium]